MSKSAGWSRHEDDILRSSDSYSEYVELGGSRSKDAWKSRRKRIGLTKAYEPFADWAEPEEPGFRPPLSPPGHKRDQWVQYFDALHTLMGQRRDLTRSAKLVNWSSPHGSLPIGLCFVGDTHIGSTGVDYEMLTSDMRTIAKTDGVYAVHMGDITDNVLLGTKAASSLYDPSESPQVQVRHAEHILSMAEGKWVLILSGNHDGWSYKAAGLNYVPDLAEKMGASYVGEGGAMLHVEAGGRTFRILCKHQHRGQSQANRSASANKLWIEWPWESESADAVCLAHLHEPDLHVMIRRGTPVPMMRTGTYKLEDSYSEKLGFKPEYGVGFLIIDPINNEVIPFAPTHWKRGLHFLEVLRHQRSNEMSKVISGSPSART